MKTYLTNIKAVDPTDGDIKLWCGPNIKAKSYAHAVEHCKRSLGYCKVIGELKSEISNRYTQ